MKQTALLIAVMIGAGALGFALYQQLSGSGNATDAMADAPEQLARSLPAVTMPDAQGDERSLEEWSGDILVINFWGTWCAPCREEVPLLVDLQTRFEDQGVTVIGIALDRAEPVRQFAEEFGINYPLLVGEDEALTAMEAFGSGTLGLPHTFVVGRNGDIVNFHLGLIEPNEVDALLAPALEPQGSDAD